jgi:cytochrome c-type biogenesis protein CcmH/NrfG
MGKHCPKNKEQVSMESKVLKIGLVLSLLATGFGGYQFTAVYKSNADLTTENQTLSTEIDNLRLTNESLLADLQEHEKLIHRLDTDLQTQAGQVRDISIEAARLGWIARGRPGMTLDDLIRMIDRK